METVSRPAATEDQQALHFARHHAFIVGIDAYQNVSRLKTAVNDARELAQVLAEKQHFEVHAARCSTRAATRCARCSETMARLVTADDRVLFYFAGHGIAADGDDGPAGYLVPADADPHDLKTFIPMAELQDALQALPCRHLLLVLDCCFSGAFKWASQTRAIGTLMPKRIYKAAVRSVRPRPGLAGHHLGRLRPEGDGRAAGPRHRRPRAGRDASRRGAFAVRARVVRRAGGRRRFQNRARGRRRRSPPPRSTPTSATASSRRRSTPGQSKRQTPGFFPLRKHDKGEFIFLHPRHRLNLPPNPGRSPYKGLQSFDETDQSLFYGRDRAIRELQARAATVRLLVVSGASGTGKSSVVKAGLLPLLRAEGHRILPVVRPGLHPLAALEQALADVGRRRARRSRCC